MCHCGERQTMSHIVNSCPQTKLGGGLQRLHSADDVATEWLKTYGLILYCVILILILYCTTTYYYVLFHWRCMYVWYVVLNSTNLLTYIRFVNALNNNNDNNSMHHYWTNFSVEVVVLVVSVQTFDVELTSITQGAVIGTDHCVRIGILPSDSSAGVFSITPHQVTAFSQ